MGVDLEIKVKNWKCYNEKIKKLTSWAKDRWVLSSLTIPACDVFIGESKCPKKLLKEKSATSEFSHWFSFSLSILEGLVGGVLPLDILWDNNPRIQNKRNILKDIKKRFKKKFTNEIYTSIFFNSSSLHHLTPTTRRSQLHP